MMATAISFVSESGDHYLNLFEGDENIEDMIEILKEQYSDEFQYLYVKNCLSSNFSVKEIEHSVDEAINAYYLDYEGDK